MTALLRNRVDWAYLFWKARAHGMMPLLYWYTNATCRDAVPSAVLNQLREHYHFNAHRNLFLTGELLKILSLFEGHGIESIPYKGPILASTVYGNLALRQFVDLDFLIHKQDALQAKDLLLSQGYRTEFPLTRGREAAYLRSERELIFVHNDGRVVLDIHWQIVPRYFSFQLDHGQLWERLEAISLGGRKIMTFSPEDLLMILCLHNGGKHHWERLGWICDVARLISMHKGMDWNRIMNQSRSLRCERVLFLGLFLARDLLGASLPHEVSTRVESDPWAKSLALQVRQLLFRNAHDKPGILKRSLFHLRMREHLRQRLQYCIRFAMVPTPEDWAFLPVAPFFSSFYYLVRPIRLIGKYGFGLFRSKDLALSEPTPIEVVGRTLSKVLES